MDMRKVTLMGLMTIALAAGSARADGGGNCPDGHDCTPPTRPVCFNLVCYYHDKDAKNGEYKECKAASTFIKNVTEDGGEVADVSEHPFNPTLEVTCDNNPSPVYNNSAYRSTDLLGTKIQGQTGPNPSISLPRGELHTGSDNNLGGNHESPSELAIDVGTAHDGQQRLRGECQIWTGNP